MARIIETESEYQLLLSPLEKLGALHGSLSAPKSSLVASFEMNNPWDRSSGMQGVRAPGIGAPWVIMLGTLRRKGGKDFAAVYGRGPARVYEFEGLEFKRWIVTE